MTSGSAEADLTHLLARLAAQDIGLSVKGEDLNVRAPRGTLTAELKAELTLHKKELVALLHGRRASFPMTDIQRAYWMGRQGVFALNSVTRGYAELECDDLDVGRLGEAWTKVVRRHEMLRVVALPAFMQRIQEEDRCEYRIEVVDLRNDAPERQTEQLARIRGEELAYLFRPEEWPPFRIHVARLDATRSRLFFNIDNLNIDGASVSILFHDWIHFYRTPQEPLPPLLYSYRDYAETTHSDRQEGSEVYQRALAHWRDCVRALPAAPQLPTIRHSGNVTDSTFSRKHARLDARAWSRLKALAAKRNITPTCAVLGAFSEILGAWSASRRFTINVTTLNRLPVHPQVGEVVGDFTSMMLLGVDAEAGPLFERFARIQDDLLAHMDHTAVSGVRILQEHARVTGEREGGAFPVVFTSFINSQMDGLARLEELGKPVYSITNTPQVTLDHQVYEVEGGLDLMWDFVEGIFPDGMLDEMLASYRKLLEDLADEAGPWDAVRPRVVPPTQVAERARVNETARPLNAKRLHELFLDQVPLRGSHPAVVCGARSLGYDDLEQSSGQVARWLRDAGVGRDELVGVVMEKGWEQVVGALAAMRAGAGYLPVDPAMPADRLRRLLTDGGVRLALTQARVDANLAWPEGVRRHCVDSAVDGGPLGVSHDTPIDAPGALEDLAYVIYTSGSTGSPKGVMIEHRNAANTVLAVNDLYGVRSDDRVLALSSLSFDLSVYDLWGTLAAGGTIVMPEPGLWRDPAYLSELMSRERVSIWNSVPALMELWIDHAGKLDDPLPDSLRLVFLSGDRIPVSLPPSIRQVLPAARVISLGGPTETSIWSVTHPDTESRPWCQTIPYGRPLPNQTIDVLDEALAPRPVWVPGEIYIGGLGVGRGYRNDDERTRAAFITAPGTDKRLYKSGDRGRWLPDGTVEILGRTDFQVKIRGYRIELGEIEAVLKEHPLVGAAVVTLDGASAADQRLVAHVVPRSKDDLAEHGPDAPDLPEAEKIAFKLARRGVRRDLSGGAALGDPTDDVQMARFAERRSMRKFRSEPLALSALGRLLGSLSGLHLGNAPLPKYRYPSGGSTYGVQTYVYVRPGRVEGLEEGIYYHHPETHQLQMVSDGTMDGLVHSPVNRQIFDASAFTIFFVGQPSAVRPLYGSLTDDFMLLEAGYMGQLLMTEAPACGIGLCPIGGMHFGEVAATFRLDEGQRYVHAMLGGAIDPAWMTVAALDEAEPPPPPGPRDRGRALVEELRAVLRSKLPEYMVPTAIALLDALPLSANGKVDRKMLVAPAVPERKPASSEYVAPTGERQKRLADLVCEILAVPEIGVHDNFFDVGGTSITLVQLHRRLGEVSPNKVSIVDVFKYPTVATLAQRLGDEADDGGNLERGRSRAALRKLRLRGDSK